MFMIMCHTNILIIFSVLKVTEYLKPGEMSKENTVIGKGNKTKNCYYVLQKKVKNIRLNKMCKETQKLKCLL